MTFREMIRGKWHALATLAGFIRCLSNWPEVWAAYRSGRRPPALRLRRGPVLHHSDDDEALAIFLDLVVHRHYTGGFYHPRPQDTVLDLGANIGFFTLYLHWLAPGIRVHCFEPASPTRARLLENLRANGLTDRVSVHPFAVSDKPGVVPLGSDVSSGRRSIVSGGAGFGSGVEEVECLTMAEALGRCQAEQIDLLKIDVEGAEIEILEGSEPDLWPRIQRVALEFHGTRRPGALARVTQALRLRGFSRFRVRTFPPVHGDGILQARR